MSTITPRCPYANTCGGCQLQHLTYADQLQKKKTMLSELFHQEVDITGHSTSWRYRNRMDFVCTPDAIGLRGDDWSEIVDVKECVIANKQINQVLTTVREWVDATGISCFDIHKKKGFLRYVVVRAEKNQLQVALTTSDTSHTQEIQQLVQLLNADSVFWTVQEGPSSTSLGDIYEVFGQETITLTFLDKTFLCDPFTFFQANQEVASQAFKKMRSYVPKNTLVTDLYCGVGVIGQCVADHVIGVESNNSSVARARKNAQKNTVDATYVCQDASTYQFRNDSDVIIVDPPRTGLQTGVFQLLASQADTILYLSCNPLTQQKDLVTLKTQYDVVELHGYDFFPHTEHIECLAVLKKRK